MWLHSWHYTARNPVKKKPQRIKINKICYMFRPNCYPSPCCAETEVNVCRNLKWWQKTIIGF